MNEGAKIDTADLRQAVERHLFRYAGSFAPYFGVRASGSYIYDEDGRAVLDFCSGQMCATLGHNHPAVTEAIEASCREVIHLFSGVLPPPVVRLAEALAGLLPPSLQRMMFLSTGGESNEAALKMAKLKTGGFEILALTGSWHGSTSGASASTYNGDRVGYGPALAGTMALPGPNCYRCPIKHCRDRCDMTCLEVGFALYDSQSVGAPAAVIAEPIQSSAGVIVPPEGYFETLGALAEARGMLLILDEAQTGLGRTGSNFGFEQIGTTPDILTLSKTLGNGVPLSATITSDEIEQVCHERKFLFYTSHLSDPMPAAVGLAVLKILEAERLAEAGPRARRLSHGWAQATAAALCLHRRCPRPRPPDRPGDRPGSGEPDAGPAPGGQLPTPLPGTGPGAASGPERRPELAQDGPALDREPGGAGQRHRHPRPGPAGLSRFPGAGLSSNIVSQSLELQSGDGYA